MPAQTVANDVLELLVAGVGNVGSTLLQQIHQHGEDIRARGVHLKVCGIASSRRYVQADNGIALANWKDALNCGQLPSSLELFRRQALSAQNRPGRRIFVDCTSNGELALSYPALMEAGFHIVSANKKANSGSLALWKLLRERARALRKHFLYSTNVGAGLPVLDTVKNLARTGDHLLRAEGILSGSLSFILGLLEQGVPLSEAVATAGKRGFTEPDPRDDLSGMDVDRKVTIVAREVGRLGEFEETRISGLLPDSFDCSGPVDAFLARLPQLDGHFRDWVETLKRRQQALRYVGTIDASGCSAGLVAVPQNHPLAEIRGGENALSLWTERYNPTPMVIRGYGAGAEVTAGGLLADVLRLAEGPIQ